jgi:branched-chain amino acid transport system ATP-binding protein
MSETKKTAQNVVLEGKNISKYFGGLKAVDDVSMEVRQGEIFGIIGPNGAGKTTFFNVCSGLLGPTHGKICFMGEDITGMRPEHIARKGVARTFQNIKLFKYMSVLENVKAGFHIRTGSGVFGAIFHTKAQQADEKLANDEGIAILERVGLLKYKDALAGNLPYGVQRTLEIARALALRPKILLLDEPAAGMNPAETGALSDFIKGLNAQGYTIAVIEHDMRFVMGTCGRILVLNFGKKICEGSPEEVKADKEVQAAYFGKGIAAGTGTVRAGLKPAPTEGK